MNPGNPKISIITPCLNMVNYIRDAIESVLAQGYQNFEHIVIDGGSTDGTVELVKSYPHIKFISEPDVNLYDAINKGITLAEGAIIGHLNSDDFYSMNVFGEIVRLFQKFLEADIVCGKACIFEDNPKNNTRKIIARYEDPTFLEFSIKSITLQPPIINAKFFRKSLYQKYGLYNIDYSISSDKELLLRFAVNGVKCAGCEKMVYNYRQHAGSITNKKMTKGQKIRMLKQDLQLSESYLQKYGYIKHIKCILTRWHTKISIHILTIYLRQRKIKGAFSIINRALRHSTQFPIALVLAFARSILNEKKRQKSAIGQG
jgi:glycosyltransferase involved in cell wall biosynthesis